MRKVDRIFFFPDVPHLGNGYGIAVTEDIKRFKFVESDLIVFYADGDKEDIIARLELPSQILLIKRNKKPVKLVQSKLRLLNPGRFWNTGLFRNFDTSEVAYVFCGDTVFYEFVHLFFIDTPAKIAIRFHNNWHKVKSRIGFLKLKTNFKFYVTNLLIDIRTERKAFLNRKADKYFISTSDLAYYRLLTGNRDGEVWGVTESSDTAGSKLDPVDDIPSGLVDVVKALRFHRFIWFGSVVAHSVDGINRFITEVFEPLKLLYPSLEFHLYGYGTEAFNSLGNNIVAHGIYKGEGLPMQNEGLYVLPDLTGGGIKLKVDSFIENEVCFLSTPFGVEGYSLDKLSSIADVVEFDLWEEHLKAKLSNIS